ncbi:MAG: nucleotide exchange factor GrpE, partial [Deltaproteobacteria bacterium]|nr:nucleotide exchange factor GrpE [Deltaproteobacteria bacterium]
MEEAKIEVDSPAAAAEEDATLEVEGAEEAPVSEVERLQAEIKDLQTLNAALKEQMLRIQAEAENFRKRMRREKDEFARFAREG